MANFQDTRTVQTDLPASIMNKDIDPSNLPDGQITHAINSQRNSINGDTYYIQNEEGNSFCINLPYYFNGSIPLKNKRFLIFSTDNTNSEIGIFSETECGYQTLINNPCLNFNTDYIIRGVSSENFNCEEVVYWCNNYNNDRFLNLSKIPYKYTLADDNCKTKVYTDEIDCKELNINVKIQVPCVSIKLSKNVGSLLNGAYQVGIVYSVAGQTVTNFFGITHPISIFSHENTGKSIEVNLTNLDTDFPEYKLHLIVTIAQQTTVYEVGVYSTTQTKVNVSNILPTATQVPLSDVYLHKSTFVKSEDVINVNNQLLWVSPSTSPEINYQPLVNKAKLEWIAYAIPVEESKDIQSYLRDEVYTFGARLLFDDGTRSSVYPFIGREARPNDLKIVSGEDAYEILLNNCDRKTRLKTWEVYNTASGSVSTNSLDKCASAVIGNGEFGYWESTELYPDNKDIYGTLACTPIRHFRFPDDSIVPRVLKDTSGNVTHIIHLGVRVRNLLHPKDNNNTLLNNVQSIEILRGDRVANESILGKGLLYNMGEYNFPLSRDVKVPGLYPNYPYNDLRTDKFLSATQTKGASGKEKNYTKMGSYSQEYYTFHSPSFSFAKPSFGTELKIEGEERGEVRTYFEPVYQHPRNKLMTDVAFIVAAMLGIGEAYLATRDKTIITTITESSDNQLSMGAAPGVPNPLSTVMNTALLTYQASIKAAKTAGMVDPTGCVEAALLKTAKTTFNTAVATAAAGSGGKITITETQVKDQFNNIPTVLRCLNGIYMFGYYFQQGFNAGMDSIKEFAKGEQYAYQVNSYCFYNNFTPVKKGSKRRYIEDINYLYPAIQDFKGQKVNNYRRESSVILKLARKLDYPKQRDNSRQTIYEAKACDTKQYTATAVSYYAAIKQPNPSQYGQIQNVSWIDTGTCYKVTNSERHNIEVILGGDTFINRFTLKRKLNYFNQTAFNENDNFEFDYRKYINLPYPRYWMNSENYNLSELVSLTPQLPDDYSNLDCKSATTFLQKVLKAPFVLRDQYFYLSNNGIIDFYVESSYNLNNRDWEEHHGAKHYGDMTTTDLSEIFRSDVAEVDNKYIYDKSYSKYLTENTGLTQSILYNPNLATTCFSKFTNKVFWSLQGNKEILRDNKLIYLPNNVAELPSENGKITGVKLLNKTNIIFLFENASPYIHQANDELQTEADIKITLGDGGLFARQPQPIINTDVIYGKLPYRVNLISSPYGILYPSCTQGKVFLLRGTELDEISKNGMQWWFQHHLPLNLTKQFPNFTLLEATKNGIGFITLYDNIKELFYLSKVDYKLREKYIDEVILENNKFYQILHGNVKNEIFLQDTEFFENLSWTISYSLDPVTRGWISFHDWHPDSLIQTEDHVISIKHNINSKKSSVWKHGYRCDKYCNFYDIQYSWDVEFVSSTGQNTSILSTIEYILESYLYDSNCQTRHHLLDYNFNKAFIYNTEQTSGNLNLNLADKKQLSKVLYYPKINTNSIDIEFHKNEQKFRFNQFWDVTKDRAEYSTNYISLLRLENDGYHFGLNELSLDYKKNIYQRKKLRHNWHKIYLKRQNEQTESMPHMKLKLINSKELNSPR